MTKKKETLIKSKERVKKYAEVNTPSDKVEAMLDLVKDEAERIDSTFLEPACGDGNFLTAILVRKLKTVILKYGKNQADFEIKMLLALSSIYGIDILEDNIKAAHDRMLNICIYVYRRLFNTNPDLMYVLYMKYILKKNIQQGDTLNGTDKIVFSKWILKNHNTFTREEYTLSELLQKAA